MAEGPTPPQIPSGLNIEVALLAIANAIKGDRQVIKSYTNAGAQGGTGYYIDLGGLKLCWGTTNLTTLSSGQTLNITFPTGFFSTIQSRFVYVSYNTTASTGTVPNDNPSFPLNNMFFWFTVKSTSATRISWFIVGS